MEGVIRREMDWDHFEELDDASTWFFGSCHRKRIARRHARALAKAGGPTGPAMPIAAWATRPACPICAAREGEVNGRW
jgi:hypothetical protein